MFTPNLPMIRPTRPAWNKGRIVGQKRLPLPKHVWAIRVRLELADNIRDLALFNTAVDSKLRGRDLVRLKVVDVFSAGRVKERTSILRSKTHKPVQFEITEGTRSSVLRWIESPAMIGSEYLWPGRFHDRPHISTRQHGRCSKIGSPRSGSNRAHILGNEAVDLVALHMVLSFGRKEAIVWARSKDMLSWVSCHLGCFSRLGGVTATVRIDNEKTAISKGAGAWGTINPSYRAFANTLKFHVDACPPRQPQAKGKVERRVRDQHHGIDPYAQSFASLEELQAWTDAQVADRGRMRRCPATGPTVAEAWEAENRVLTPLPDPLPVPFDVAVSRRVGPDGLVAFEGRQYSVPFHLIGESVEVRGTHHRDSIRKSGCRLNS